VNCVLGVDILNHGMLHDGDEDDHDDGTDDVAAKPLIRGTRMEWPLWLAESLALSSTDFITLNMPKPFSQRYRSMLSASPVKAELGFWCPYYYLFGVKWASLIEDENLVDTLSYVFKTRIQSIMDYTQAPMRAYFNDHSQDDFLQSLDETERALYKLGQEANMIFHKWSNKHEKSHRVRVATSLILSTLSNSTSLSLHHNWGESSSTTTTTGNSNTNTAATKASSSSSFSDTPSARSAEDKDAHHGNNGTSAVGDYSKRRKTG